MKNQREIIRNVRSVSLHELLDLVVYNPFFLTDAYYVEIGKAVRSRYTELKSDFQMYSHLQETNFCRAHALQPIALKRNGSRA